MIYEGYDELWLMNLVSDRIPSSSIVAEWMCASQSVERQSGEETPGESSNASPSRRETWILSPSGSGIVIHCSHARNHAL